MIIKRLALAAVALALLVPLAARADGGDDHHHHDDRRPQWTNACQYGQPCYGQYPYGNNQGGEDRDEHRGNPHGCYSPAGNMRGWCRNQGYNGYNGYNGYGQGNATLAGVITSVNGSSITILQGLSTRTFDASQAFARRAVYGQLYPTRSITAYGYYDGGGYFHAVSIR